jgi:hypothetical protein
MLYGILSLSFGLSSFLADTIGLDGLLWSLGLPGIIIKACHLVLRFASLLGFGLGIYGFIIERRTLKMRSSVETMCVIGMILSAVPFLFSHGMSIPGMGGGPSDMGGGPPGR